VNGFLKESGNEGDTMGESDPVIQSQCSERIKHNMEWGRETAATLTKELTDLATVTQKLNLSSEKLSWVISDPDAGIVMQVKQLAKMVGDIKEAQWGCGSKLNFLDESFEKYVEEKKEEKRPVIALAYGLIEKILWSILVGMSTWLFVTRK
jgi:hypothetical protein